MGAALAQDRTPTAIANIRQETTDRSTRLFVECTGPVAYTYYSPDPLTLVVDIPEADASQVAPRIAIGTREVESVRVTSMARADGHSLARLEVKLASLVPYQIYSKDKSLNLVFERPAAAAEAKPWPVDKDSKATATAEAAPPPAEAPKPAPEPAAEPPQEKPAPAPEAALVAEAAPAPHGAKASRILGLTYAEEKGQLAFTVRADGSLRYQDFFLGNPDRLVIDFADVSSRSPVRNLDVNSGPVRKARLAQFSASSPKVARLVLDLSARAPYRIVEGSDGVKILFGEGQTPTPAPLAALRPEPEPAAVSAASAIPPAVLPAPALPAPALPAPDALPEAQITTDRASLQSTTVAGAQKVYTGHPISLDFKDGDLQDIFRLFADISGLNVVVNPGVSGKVTLKLTEVPWDQALDLILKTNGLGYTLEDNVIRIAKLADLQKEEQERRKLAEEKALAGELLVQNFRLSYSKAKELEPTIKKVALSPRGQIITDDRTNTMIVTDLALNLEKTRNLIADLDRATPQVEIEARIVVTTRTFLQQYGVQWGFINQQTPLFGNTTNRAFPHSIILNGGGVPGSGGLSPTQGGLATEAGIGPAGRGYAVNLPAAAFNSAIGISLGNILGNFNIDAALTALENSGRGRVISTPKVTTQNNQAAEIKQGVQIPIQTVANNTVTVIFKDAVLTLKVTPQITEAGTVILTLEVENNSPDFSRQIGTGATAVPPINTQSAKTIVLVRDGSTAVIGGIYQSTEQSARAQTPILGNIPILGYLFRNRSVRSENAELMIFVTPRIIKS
jgi:type IV pilus assembly protein PilQ